MDAKDNMFFMSLCQKKELCLYVKAWRTNTRPYPVKNVFMSVIYDFMSKILPFLVINCKKYIKSAVVSLLSLK